MSSKLVERRLNDFKRRCGKDGDAALQLAYHAAMPVALNPDLLHFLRINFFLDPPEQLPYTVEFEFLTSGLCREIDAELYEIEPEIRSELLQKLMSREDAQQRIRDIATLLWQYVEYHSPWADRVELERAQQLTALNFLDPAKAKEWLDEAEANASLGRGEREWFIAMQQELEELPYLPITSFASDEPASNQFDVLFFYNSQDRQEVRNIAQKLKQRGLKPWLDEDQIYAGDSITDTIEQGLEHSKTVAVFIGEAGLEAWATRWSIEKLTRLTLGKNTPIIPVLLPGVVVISSLPAILRDRICVSFNGGINDTEALDLLVWGITRQNPQSEQDDLSSEKGVDYTRLRDLLAAGKWKEADEETLAVMLQVAEREKEGWLSIKSIENFPCTDLRTIDQLWVKYSNGRFGFSVQKRIWESVGGKPGADYGIWEKFGDYVGWRSRWRYDVAIPQKEWLSYDELHFTKTAREGHLPVKVISLWARTGSEQDFDDDLAKAGSEQSEQDFDDDLDFEMSKTGSEQITVREIDDLDDLDFLNKIRGMNNLFGLASRLARCNL
ncbi:GUN4 domain-containing protein [Scytonema sp. PCC 10023]|uniref:GUN4 domain-containing protein n=1 Tax=Scytonema sp. PCC 10023 TaxID=1680591 RepID=UPI0039C75497